MEKNKEPFIVGELDHVDATTTTLTLEKELSADPGGDPKKKPEIEPEKLPKEDPGTPGEEPDEDDDDDYPLVEPPIGDDPDKEKNKLPIMLL